MNAQPQEVPLEKLSPDQKPIILNCFLKNAFRSFFGNEIEEEEEKFKEKVGTSWERSFLQSWVSDRVTELRITLDEQDRSIIQRPVDRRSFVSHIRTGISSFSPSRRLVNGVKTPGDDSGEVIFEDIFTLNARCGQVEKLMNTAYEVVCRLDNGSR